MRRPGKDRIGTYAQQVARYLSGTSGPAGPCKRICPKTGEVIEIIEAKPVEPRPRQPPGYEHYTPEFVQAIKDTCSTQADRAGQTQDEVFETRGTP